MKKGFSKILAVLLCIVMIAGIVPFSLGQKASAISANDSSVFLHQPKDGDSTCVFTSCLNMFRRRAIIDGDDGWQSITHSNYSSTITTNGVSVRWTITNVRGMNASMTSSLTSNKKSFFISMLNDHPEGIVIYCGSSPMHTVLLTDYDSSTDTFYCAETLSAFGYGRIPLTSCYISTANGGLSQAGVISKISQIWYITNRSGGSIESTTYTEPPTKPIVRLDKTIALVNQNVTISFSSERASYYWIGIYKDGVLFSQSGVYENSYTISYPWCGRYDVVVAAKNDCGETKGYTSFYVGNEGDYVPVNFTVSCNRRFALKNTDVVLSFHADNADSYWIGIYTSAGYLYDQTVTRESTYTTQCPWTGDYSVAIVARNECSSVTKYINLSVIDPSDPPPVPTVTVSGEIGLVNEDIVISFSSQETEYYWIGIYKDNELFMQRGVYDGNTWTINCSQVGQYVVVVAAKNNRGETKGYANFYIVDQKDFIIQYVPQGGNGTPANQTKHYGQLLTLTTETPTRGGYTFIGWNTKADGTGTNYAPGASYTAEADVTLYAQWVANPPAVNPAAGSGTVIDESKHFLYGLSAASGQGCVAVTDGTAAYEYPTARQVMGTGTKVNVFNNDNQLVDSYTVVVFGDIDGDGWYDGTDAYFVGLVANGLISQSALTAAQLAACDANHDGMIDAADAALLEQAGLLLANVDQTMPQEELQTDSVYLEYCSLIDQTVEIIEPEQPAADQPAQTAAQPAEQPAAQSVWGWIKALFTIVLNWLLRVF